MFTPLFSLQAQIQGKAMSEAETKTEMTSIKASWGCWREVTYEGDKEMSRELVILLQVRGTHSMGLQKVRHDLASEQQQTVLIYNRYI